MIPGAISDALRATLLADFEKLPLEVPPWKK